MPRVWFIIISLDAVLFLNLIGEERLWMFVCLSDVIWFKTLFRVIIHSSALLSNQKTGQRGAVSSQVEKRENKTGFLWVQKGKKKKSRLCPVPLKVGAETPSVPGRHGTSSLPTWPPRRLCHWRRIAAVGIAAPPPPAAPLETPPAASARPAALDVSRRTARTGCRQNNHQKHTLGKLWTNTLRILILKTVIRSTRVLFSLNHLGMNLLCERFIKSFLLFFLSILLYFFLSLSFSWPRRVKSWKLGENKKLFKIPSELLSNALIMAATKTFVIQDLDSDSYGSWLHEQQHPVEHRETNSGACLSCLLREVFAELFASGGPAVERLQVLAGGSESQKESDHLEVSIQRCQIWEHNMSAIVANYCLLESSIVHFFIYVFRVNNTKTKIRGKKYPKTEALIIKGI